MHGWGKLCLPLVHGQLDEELEVIGLGAPTRFQLECAEGRLVSQHLALAGSRGVKMMKSLKPWTIFWVS